MNVLMIAPPRLQYLRESKGTIPVPFLHLAAMLRTAGHNSDILDFSVVKPVDDQDSLDFCAVEVVRRLENRAVGLIFVNCFTSMHFQDMLTLIKRIRLHNTQIPICIGGAHPTLFPEIILKNCPEIDYIIVGEGEEQALLLANALANSDFNALESIQAFCYRDSAGQIVLNQRHSYIEVLDSLPAPAWDLINLADYYGDHSTWYNPKKKKINLSVPILSSRSCPFRCNFCGGHSMMGRGFRKRSIQSVVDEIQLLTEKYGQNYFGFIDDNVNLDRDHIIGLCNEIVRRNLDIQFETVCGAHIASLTDEIVAAMAQGGCVFVRLPIEHGNDYIRNEVIGKQLPREKIFAAVEYLKKHNIYTSSMFIMGFAEDTCETLEDTVKIIMELQMDQNYVFNLIPLPGTRCLEQAIRDNLLLENYDPTRLWEGGFNLDPVQSEQSFYLKPYKMTIEELQHFRQRFNRLQLMSEQARAINKCR